MKKKNVVNLAVTVFGLTIFGVTVAKLVKDKSTKKSMIDKQMIDSDNNLFVFPESKTEEIVEGRKYINLR